MRIKLICIAIFIIGLISACNKDEEISFDPSLRLQYSTDSVLFDTVFTSVGSTSRRIKIFNRNQNAILLSKVKLAGGSNSPFSINVNGMAVTETQDLRLNGNDSLNLFVKVNINPNSQIAPFIVEDSILLDYNGKKEKIPLAAYGQNAIFFNKQTINTNTTWDSKLPYIIYNDLTVANNAVLSIAAGTKVLFHSNATLSIKGTLLVNGTKTDTVTFTSDRRERIYENEAGQWNGVRFYGSSKNSIINYSVVKNGTAGITVDSLSVNANPKLILANTIVKNMQVVGFLGYHAELTAFNNLFYNCGQYLFYGVGGGVFNLKHNTFGAYNFVFARRTPAVFLSDWISTTEFAGLNINFTNNVVWGNLEEEFNIERKSSATSSVTLQNNLLKTKGAYSGNNNILNTDPLFNAPRYGLFEPLFGSPVLNKGVSITADSYYNVYLNKDLKNQTRLQPSELGCYENN